MSTRFCLREFLEEAGISQSELARQAGVSFATVNRISTNATQRVDLETLDRISVVLKREPGELLVREPAGSRKRR